MKNKYKDENATIYDITNLVNQYIKASQDNSHSTIGYPSKSGMTPSHSYSISKVAVIAITRIQQRDIDKDTSRSGILVNSMCPGYCKTDMARGGGYLTADQGYSFSYIFQLILKKIN